MKKVRFSCLAVLALIAACPSAHAGSYGIVTSSLKNATASADATATFFQPPPGQPWLAVSKVDLACGIEG